MPQTATRHRPRGVCPVCGRSVALRASGELRDHQGRTKRLTEVPGRPYAWCPGSGQVTAPVEGEGT